MFLSESYLLESDLMEDDLYMEDHNDITPDTTCGMELILEATEMFNALDMAMIKLEHQAIVSEDAGLLQEGMDDFAKKAKQTAKVTKERFIQWLDKVRDMWERIQGKIRDVFLTGGRIAKLKSALDAGIKAASGNDGSKYIPMIDVKIDMATAKDLYTRFVTIAKGIKAGSTNATNYTSTIKDDKDRGNNSGAMRATYGKAAKHRASVAEMRAALDFLQYRENFLKAIKYVRSAVSEWKSDLDSEDANYKNSKANLINAQKYCNKAVALVNKYTTAALACAKAAKAAADLKSQADYKAGRSANKDLRSAYKNQDQSYDKYSGDSFEEGILGSFMFD